MCIFYYLSPLSSPIVRVANIISLNLTHSFTCFKVWNIMLLNYSAAGAPILWTFINWIQSLHFYIAVEFAVDFICKCTTLMPWKDVIDGQIDGARGNILAVLCCTPLQAPPFLSLSNIVMLSLSVYVTYAGIGNVNSWLFSVWFEWSIV